MRKQKKHIMRTKSLLLAGGITLATFSGCDNGAEKIKELEGKVSQLQSRVTAVTDSLNTACATKVTELETAWQAKLDSTILAMAPKAKTGGSTTSKPKTTTPSNPKTEKMGGSSSTSQKQEDATKAKKDKMSGK